VETAKQTGDRFGISMTVLGELYYAAYASKRQQENLTKLSAFLQDVILWDYDRAGAEEFGRLQAEQKAKGKPIPSSDAQIAAIARLHGLVVLTEDHHFGFISGLTIENWLS